MLFMLNQRNTDASLIQNRQFLTSEVPCIIYRLRMQRVHESCTQLQSVQFFFIHSTTCFKVRVRKYPLVPAVTRNV